MKVNKCFYLEDFFLSFTSFLDLNITLKDLTREIPLLKITG